MRRYTPGDEERILLQHRVRDWARVGLLTPDQGAQLESELKVALRRTGRMLRIGLAVFTALAVAAALGFVVLLLDVNSEAFVGLMVLAGAAGCFAGADWLVVRYRLYRHGIEEALAVSAVVLACVGLGFLLSWSDIPSVTSIVIALVAGAGGAYHVYRRFGFQYAAVAAMVCVAAIPLQMRLPAPVQVLAASAVLAVTFGLARRARLRHHDEVQGEEARTVEACAILGTYLMLNLHVGGVLPWIGADVVAVPWFKWTTYVMVWVLPPAIIWLGTRERERLVVDVGITTMLVTLTTNKLYLGTARNPWDPILFGVIVAGAALLVRRWLGAGRRGERGGFTSARVSADQADVVSTVGTVSAFQPVPSAQGGMDQRPEFGGGRSGGGGGGADF